MSDKVHKRNPDRITAKKAAVLGTAKRNRLPVIAAIAGVILIVGAALLYVGPGRSDRMATALAPSSSSGTVVSFPASLFENGKAHHFEHVHGDLTIRYFILKSSDGIIRAAFDACDVCWRAGKGYYQEGDFMVCRNCSRKFASVLVNEVEGGCNPAPLHREMEEDQVIIRVEDILEGRQYFDFSGKA